MFCEADCAADSLMSAAAALPAEMLAASMQTLIGLPGELPHDRKALGLPGTVRLRAGRREGQRPGDGDTGHSAGLQAVQERPEQPLVILEPVAPGAAFGQATTPSVSASAAHRPGVSSPAHDQVGPNQSATQPPSAGDRP